MSTTLFRAGQGLTKAYKKFDDFLDKGVINKLKDRFKNKKAASVDTLGKSKALDTMGKSKALTIFDPKKALPSKTLAKTATSKLGKLKTAGRILSKGAVPLTIGFEVANIGYKMATRTPAQKARAKALKTKLKKTSTKDYHSDLLKMSVGGDTMLKNPKKADLDKDGKLSSYEKKRGKAIEANMKAKKGKMMYAKAGMSVKGDDKRDIRKTESMIGASKSSKREKKIMKASVGKSVRGYGAARTSGMGLQDEQLIPGKSLDYYKDLM